VPVTTHAAALTSLLPPEQGLDPETRVIMGQVNDLLASNHMWSWLIEIQRAGVEVTLALMQDVAQGIREGVLC
jgi:hypothetical protein